MVTAQLPDGVCVDATGERSVYGWRVLPPHPALLAFVGALAAVIVGVGPLLLAFGVARLRGR